MWGQYTLVWKHNNYISRKWQHSTMQETSGVIRQGLPEHQWCPPLLDSQFSDGLFGEPSETLLLRFCGMNFLVGREGHKVSLLKLQVGTRIPYPPLFSYVPPSLGPLFSQPYVLDSQSFWLIVGTIVCSFSPFFIVTVSMAWVICPALYLVDWYSIHIYISKRLLPEYFQMKRGYKKITFVTAAT